MEIKTQALINRAICGPLEDEPSIIPIAIGTG